MKQFKVQIRRRGIPNEEILADLKQTAGKLGKKSITRLEYDEHGSFGATTVLRRFKKWNQALEGAGLEVPHLQDISDDELFENLANVWMKVGRQPYGREMEKAGGHSKYSLGTYEKRFKSWNNALLAFEKSLESGERRVGRAPRLVEI